MYIISAQSSEGWNFLDYLSLTTLQLNVYRRRFSGTKLIRVLKDGWRFYNVPTSSNTAKNKAFY